MTNHFFRKKIFKKLKISFTFSVQSIIRRTSGRCFGSAETLGISTASRNRFTKNDSFFSTYLQNVLKLKLIINLLKDVF